MRDLEQFYQTMRMHFAFEQMCYGYDELTLYEDGRYFAGLPFFEKYKYDPDSFLEVDYSSAGGDLLKEMRLDNEAIKDRTQGDGFERVPFDYYEQLQETLVDMIPGFRIRLKVDPRTRKMVFAADVHSVFDICWFTLAKKFSEDVTPEEKGTSADVKPARQGMVMSCPFCKEAYIRTANRAVTCEKTECHRARKAMNKRNSRKKQKIAALKSNPAGKAEESSPGAFKPPGVPFRPDWFPGLCCCFQILQHRR